MDRVQLTLWPFKQRPRPQGRGEAAHDSAADSSFGDSKFSDSRLDPRQPGLDLFPGQPSQPRPPALRAGDRTRPAGGQRRAGSRPAR